MNNPEALLNEFLLRDNLIPNKDYTTDEFKDLFNNHFKIVDLDKIYDSSKEVIATFEKNFLNGVTLTNPLEKIEGGIFNYYVLNRFLTNTTSIPLIKKMINHSSSYFNKDKHLGYHLASCLTLNKKLSSEDFLNSFIFYLDMNNDMYDLYNGLSLKNLLLRDNLNLDDFNKILQNRIIDQYFDNNCQDFHRMYLDVIISIKDLRLDLFKSLYNKIGEDGFHIIISDSLFHTGSGFMENKKLRDYVLEENIFDEHDIANNLYSKSLLKQTFSIQNPNFIKIMIEKNNNNLDLIFYDTYEFMNFYNDNFENLKQSSLRNLNFTSPIFYSDFLFKNNYDIKEKMMIYSVVLYTTNFEDKYKNDFIENVIKPNIVEFDLIIKDGIDNLISENFIDFLSNLKNNISNDNTNKQKNRKKF